MILNEKSLSFARKILKHNPVPLCHEHKEEQHQQKHQNCLHQPQQQLKPYLHVHDHRKQRQIYQKPTQQKLSNMQNFKSEGNQHFKSKKFRQAAHYYQKIIIYADYTFPQAEKDQKLMNELVQSANCNLGITLVKLGETKKALQSFNQSIKGPIEKIKIKSNYWLTKCYIQLGDFKKVHNEIQKLENYGNQTVKQVSQLKIELKKRQENYQKKNKNVFEQMFGKQTSNSK